MEESVMKKIKNYLLSTLALCVFTLLTMTLTGVVANAASNDEAILVTTEDADFNARCVTGMPSNLYTVNTATTWYVNIGESKGSQSVAKGKSVYATGATLGQYSQVTLTQGGAKGFIYTPYLTWANGCGY
jgi:hypothetical protein